ncbi:MAG: NAD-dependent epimerase/dehydratase family protein [Segetibacter sp.]
MHILITGGAGFVGSNLALFLKQKYSDYTITVLDNLKRRGSELNLPRLKAAGIIFLHGDIRNAEDFEQIDNDVDYLIEASAEPSVMAGVGSSPKYLINTNLNGTINCLYFAKERNAKVIFLSTSRVYPVEALNSCNYNEAATRFNFTDDQNLPGISAKGVSEEFPLSGYRTLYGTTKLASELLLPEFLQTYKVPYIIDRCGVLTGPWQMGKVDQGVAVLWMAAHYWKKPISYIGFGGSGKQVRDLLHINDLCVLLDEQIHKFNKFSASTYNVGGGLQNAVSLKELTSMCSDITGNSIEIAEDKKQREGDIRIYVSNNSQLYQDALWRPKRSVKETLQDVYDWIQQNEMQLKNIL